MPCYFWNMTQTPGLPLAAAFIAIKTIKTLKKKQVSKTELLFFIR